MTTPTFFHWNDSPIFAKEGMSTIPRPPAPMRPLVFGKPQSDIEIMLREAGVKRLTKVTK